MPWPWKSGSSPSSSSPSPRSSSSSAAGSPASPRRARRGDNFLWYRRDSQPQAQPRLTRQRKLRHLDDIEVRGLVFDSPAPSAAAAAPAAVGGGGGGGGGSANSTPVSRSPSNLDVVPPRLSSSFPQLPQPLPLPDEAAAASPRREFGLGLGLGLGTGASASSPSRAASCPLPSPRGTPGGGDGEEGSSTVDFSSAADPVGHRVTSFFSTESKLPHQIAHKRPERCRSDFPINGNSHHRKVFQDTSSVDSVNFRLNIPAKSAPASGISSPVRSPRRSSNVDLSTSAMTTQHHQVWSAPDFPSTDTTTLLSPHMSPEKFMGSPEPSPRYSPSLRSPVTRSRNPSAPSSPLHSKLFPESSNGRHDSNNGNVNVHPLPLPPGASPGPMQSGFAHQPTHKTEVSPMTGQWQKGKLIGSGTYGNVFEATNRHTGALCAMKEVNIIPDDAKSAECLKQLEQEIKFLSQFKHPNIVQYYGSELIEDRFYIYLEYVHPGSINKYVRQHFGAMTESVIRNFTRHILNGLAYLHSKDIMHRDIKGANLLVDVHGVVKLADFGMAKHLSGAAPNLSLKGTPYWMAPEVLQATLNKEIGYDLAVDIWSLGCTIIEMFTGQPPWSGLEGPAALFKVLNKNPTIPETLSSEGKDFLQLCFRRNPAERPKASKLLDHAFIKNSHHHNIHGSVQAFAGIKLRQDTTNSPRDRKSSKSDPCLKGKQPKCETNHSYPETSESASSRPSPRSNPEFPRSLSPPHRNQLASTTAMHLGNGNFHPCALPKPYEKEVLHL
ncbi:Mitogen-activated protein kinase kinase kinase YODA [Ananas comosus]|uniref:mitogen-activated protein kinase kinase kinase n=1 Tax=Ananas comosus TaxID=4615 RepID=A0A199W558_ANACO|nr:Mitogen-activated protein kinase kinase kinase YODA [Ananas comosus]